MRGKKPERITLQKMIRRQIKGMRNIYAHDYDIIDNDIIWETIIKEIPELKEKLQAIFLTL